MQITNEVTAPKPQKQLTITDINPASLNVEYAVRGKVVQIANELQREIDTGQEKCIERVIKANIGDSQAVGQCPLTFSRQVLAACAYPPLLSQNVFPLDVNNRAEFLIKSMKGSIGCYTQSVGVDEIRKKVSRYISDRDGYACDYNDIFLTNGASSAIKLIIYSLMKNIDNLLPGIMVPIPQYPLYSATISEYGGHLIGYYLDEDSNWQLNIEECERALFECQSQCYPRAMVVINPGNPTGQVLPYSNIVEIIKFCSKHNLLLLADEVYQKNIYDKDSTFHSFKKVVQDIGYTPHNFQLVSFNSASKGFYGECGIRGGYMELFGFSDDVKSIFTKLLSAQLCSSSCGQVIIDTIVDPPKPSDPSYSVYISEKEAVLQHLAYNAHYLYQELNKIPFITCNKIQGAMYAFVRLQLPQSFQEEAQTLNLAVDEHYCFLLLKRTGICTVPGSGFKQKPGTYHFRTTILPSIEELKKMIQSFRECNQFIQENYN